ncbi:unnamed protein product, partial [Rotaria sp. Silwood2]
GAAAAGFQPRWTSLICAKTFAPVVTLTKLKIDVPILTDCLYLLDGPFVCLSTLIINIESIYH